MSRLVNDLIKNGYLKTDIIIDAFSEIHRVNFIPKELESEAGANIPLPIGYGQTISQPLTVALMLELLDPGLGHNILDVGSGSGWTVALLSSIVGTKGKVTAAERIPELYEFGKKNADKFNFVKKGIAEFYNIDGSKGYEKNSPYDRIIVSAMTEDIPRPLKEQLKVGGKMVIPVHNDIWYIEKKGEDDLYIEKYSGFSFVPLIHKSND
ncbi:protein-L-isoaspartate O-methyltransferase [bacterium BMS3Abin15]|nr:protein-L-isoaspartate O-methyltransferase [bacterium BMS3Abin15]HDH07606.1 protein-L-isoaspartate O-methyltransferase [Candidatus Moranbacteria bacterium]HDZ85275.1 protein-L-isoaspartate O-methyltransferase [Candidatus Moranbacteria bacterium]